MKSLTLEQAQIELDAMPPPATMLRSEFDKIHKNLVFDYKGCYSVHLFTKYKCLGPYGPNQQIYYLGFDLTAWVDHHRQESCLIVPSEDIEKYLPDLIAKANTMCPHKNVTELPSSRMFEHNYHCNDCGAEYSTDSSG